MLNLKRYIIPFLLFIINLAFGNLICPADGVELNYIHVLFEWEQEPDAIGYNIQVSTLQFFNNLLLDVDEATTVYIDKDNFSWDDNYYWKVRPYYNDDEFIQMAGLLRKAGVHLLNQTVLLAGINDNVQTLNQLSHRLMDAGVLPYYLHLLDPVEGASHFNISDAQAIQFVRELLEQLPGYLVPKLVREVAGFKNKLPVDLGLYTQK